MPYPTFSSTSYDAGLRAKEEGVQQRSLFTGDAIVVMVESVDVTADHSDRSADICGAVATAACAVDVACDGNAAAVVGVAVRVWFGLGFWRRRRDVPFRRFRFGRPRCAG